VSSSSFTIFLSLFFRTSVLTSSPHFLNQSAMLLTSPYLGLDSCSQIQLKGLRSAQPRWLWQWTHFMFPGLANRFDFSPMPVRSLPPTLPRNPCNAASAGDLVTLLLYAKKRDKLARSVLSSITVPPTHVLTKADRKRTLGSLSEDAVMPPLLPVSTLVVSTSLAMAPVPSASKSSPLSVLPGTKTFPMPPMRASPKPPLRVQLLTQLYRLLQPGMVLVSLLLPANVSNLKPLNSFAARPPSVTSRLPSLAGTSLVLAAPSSKLEPVATGVSPRRPMSRWSFRCRQAQPQYTVLHHPNHSIILVV